jgi:CHAT domain-containing protein
MADLASYYVAITLIARNKVAAAHAALRAIASGLPDRYRGLAAHIHWELALCASIAGDWGSTLREADAAAAIFLALGEPTNVATVDGMATYALERMGATDLAWSRRIRAIAALRGDTHRSRRATILHVAALGLEATDRTAAAEAVLDLVLEDHDDPNVNVMTIALADRARLAGRNGDMAVARSSLADARSWAVRLEDAGPREMTVASIELGEAVLLGKSDPRAALPAFDRAIAYFTERRADALLAEAYLQRARAQKAAGDPRAAAADYAAALHEVGRQRRSAREGDVRIAFADTASQIVEESIELHLTRGEVAAALEVAELLPALLRADATRVEEREPLPADVAAIRYVLLRDRLAIFCVSSGGIAARSVWVDRRHLALLLAQFADRVRSRAPVGDVRSAGAALYALLVAPVEGLLAGKHEIVVIPDRELHIVPFAALYDERQRQYLIDRYTIRIAPSVAGAAPIAARELTPAVVIADPATPLGPRLPASRSEAEQIAAMHDATLIRGEEATVPRFTESAGRSALIHYAGHADSDFREAYGALLLSPAGQDRGILGSSEIARLALPHRPLVVLAACGTARGEAVHIAGMSTLARAFLDARARAVVGTLWELDDDAAGPLFLRIHERLRDGTSPARAVREAQTAMLQSPDERLAHPATWAAVAVISNSEQP